MNEMTDAEKIEDFSASYMEACRAMAHRNDRVAQPTGTMASRMAGNPRGSGYRRADLDWYVEPRSATRALLQVERFDGDILDPACGCGNIVNECLDHGLSARGTDIAHRGFGGEGIDFLSDHYIGSADNVICNPPFGISLDFARKSLIIARRKVAFIQRLAWLEGQRRSAFMETSPLARIYVFRNRICMPPGEKKDLPAKGGFIAYAWFVWDKAHSGPPTVHWITA